MQEVVTWSGYCFEGVGVQCHFGTLVSPLTLALQECFLLAHLRHITLLYNLQLTMRSIDKF